MLNSSTPPSNVLDLPPEIIVKIVSKLPYIDIQSVRLTCVAFNDAGLYVQRTALHKMRGKAETALKICHITGSLSVTPARALRAVKGTASVMCLSGIVRIADASTFPFILDGMLPPAPAALLVDVDKALSIAAKKNPLVGRDRLKRIFSNINKYMTFVMHGLNSPLKMISVFRSTMDLLISLPFKTHTIAQTDHGLHCLIHLNFLTVMFNRCAKVLTASDLIHFLAKLNVKGIQEFITIDMGNLFAEEIKIVDATIDLIELSVTCRPEECDGVDTLKKVFNLEPVNFEVRLHGVTFVRSPSQRNLAFIKTSIRGRPLLDGEELATFVYSTRPQPPDPSAASWSAVPTAV